MTREHVKINSLVDGPSGGDGIFSRLGLELFARLHERVRLRVMLVVLDKRVGQCRYTVIVRLTRGSFQFFREYSSSSTMELCKSSFESLSTMVPIVSALDGLVT